MYIPYLRGRQFELLALKALLEGDRIGSNVIPLIEPVKFSATLINTLDTYIAKTHPIGVIRNPQVGSFRTELFAAEDSDDENKKIKHDGFMKKFENKNVLSAYILEEAAWGKLTQIAAEKGSLENTVIIANKRDAVETFGELLTKYPGKLNLMPDEREYKRSIPQHKVLLNDWFNKRDRNADYKDHDEMVSEDYLYYKKEGYIGFADYSIVGDEFKESGFAPNAIALHIAYFEKNKLKVRHFTSDSNDDYNDPAKKYSEALGKLMVWKTGRKYLDTLAMNAFSEQFDKGSYPGLGSIKKLCIMQHIELVSRYLDGEIK
jgi:hypothetical protein